MSRQKVDDVLSWMLGVCCFGGIQTGWHWSNEALKFFISILSAFVAGLFGYLGKEWGRHLKQKRLNKKKNGNKDI